MTGAGNNTWLVDGAEPLLVDAGVGAADHLDAIARALGGRPLARVVITHGHADHASGAPAIRARWPRVDICKMTNPGEVGFRSLEDGDELSTGSVTLRAIHTPGHAPDHLCLWHPSSRRLFTGDMLVLGSTVMIPAGRGGHLGQYLKSLRAMAALDPAVAYPGHGPVIENPLAVIDEYLAHREERERQVLACLENGLADVEAMVDAIYPTLDAALRPAARLTVEAHLEKLRDEGRVPA